MIVTTWSAAVPLVHAEHDTGVLRWLTKTAAAARLTASVCTGAFLLAAAGLLDRRRATTHWEDIDELARSFPRVHVETGVRWLDDGDIVTSAGIAAGIDMSLHLVQRLAGAELAMSTARQMDYEWRDLPRQPDPSEVRCRD